MTVILLRAEIEAGSVNQSLTSGNVWTVHVKKGTVIIQQADTLGGVRLFASTDLLTDALDLCTSGKERNNVHRPGGTESHGMQCYENLVHYLSCGILLAGLVHLVHHKKVQASYGRHMAPSSARTVPARLAWFLQEMPALLVPVLFLQFSHHSSHTGKHLILKTFCLHYFQR